MNVFLFAILNYHYLLEKYNTKKARKLPYKLIENEQYTIYRYFNTCNDSNLHNQSIKKCLGKKTGNEQDIVEKYSRGKANSKNLLLTTTTSGQTKDIRQRRVFHKDSKINT